jgi:hypothetical protein
MALCDASGNLMLIVAATTYLKRSITHPIRDNPLCLTTQPFKSPRASRRDVKGGWTMLTTPTNKQPTLHVQAGKKNISLRRWLGWAKSSAIADA